jgi:hypothetical protein
VSVGGVGSEGLSECAAVGQGIHKEASRRAGLIGKGGDGNGQLSSTGGVKVILGTEDMWIDIDGRVGGLNGG